MTEEDALKYITDVLNSNDRQLKYDDDGIAGITEAAMALFPKYEYDVSVNHDTGVVTVMPYLKPKVISIMVNLDHDTP